MLKEIFTRERELINFFFDNVDLVKVEEVLDYLVDCKGSIVFTGVGKSGNIAYKISKTMVSVGIKSNYINSADALHGDVAVVEKNDVVVILSKSGNTYESLYLAKFFKQKEITTVALVCKRESPLCKLCNHFLYLPLRQELCFFNLVPTTSNSIQLIFGDVMVVVLMKKRGFDLHKYGLNHPGGEIGKLINKVVKDVMMVGAEIPICSPKDSVKQALLTMVEKSSSDIFVVEKKILKGVFGEVELKNVLSTGGSSLCKLMEEVMNKSFSFTGSDMPLVDLLKQMEGKKLLPVVNNKELVGVVNLRSI